MKNNESFNDIPDQYEKARPKYDNSILKVISNCIVLKDLTKILEIGCGIGQATELLSATTYHWITQPDGDLKTVELLNPDGLFVLIHNYHINQNEGFFVESQEIYKNHLPIGNIKKDEVELISKKYFRVINRAEYFWEEEYYTASYFNLLSTYSDHIVLNEMKRQSLFNELKGLIDKNYNCKIVKKYKTVIEIGKHHQFQY